MSTDLTAGRLGRSSAPVPLDGATLTPEAVARIARDRAPAQLAAEAHERNDAARAAIGALSLAVSR